MKKYVCFIGLLGALLCNTATSYAQKIAVKSNLLYDATTTMNLGLEIGLACQAIIIRGSLMMRYVCVIGVYSRNYAIGSVKGSTVISLGCMDIMPNIT